MLFELYNSIVNLMAALEENPSVSQILSFTDKVYEALSNMESVTNSPKFTLLKSYLSKISDVIASAPRLDTPINEEEKKNVISTIVSILAYIDCAVINAMKDKQ